MADPIKTLEARLAGTNDPIEKLALLNQLSTALRFSDPPRSLVLGKKAVELSLSPEFYSLKPSNDVIQSLLHLGEIYLDSEKYADALKQFLWLSILLGEKNQHTQIGIIFNGMAVCYEHFSKYSEAILYYNKALVFFEKQNNPALKAKVLNNLGRCTLHLPDYSKAFEYLNRSLTIAETLNLADLIAEILENLSRASYFLENYENALSSTTRAIKLYEGTSPARVSELLCLAGLVYESQGRFEDAAAFYKRALGLAEKNELSRLIVEILYHCGSLNIKTGNIDLAISQLQKALSKANEIGWIKDLYKVYQILHEAYRLMGNHKDALVQFQHYHHLYKDFLESRFEDIINANKIESNVRLEEKDLRIRYLESGQILNKTNDEQMTKAAIEKLAISDPLTGLYNRRYYLSRSDEELKKAIKNDLKLSVILLNIAHFRVINENHGNLFGDQVLYFIADRIRSALRETDISARFGGEEFAILLPESNAEQAENVAKRLLHEIGLQPFKIEDKNVQISLNIGITCLKSGENINIETFLSRANQALFEAKNLGENLIKIFCG